MTIDYTSRDYEGFKSDMITLLQELLPTYTDTSSSDAGIVLIELFAYMLDHLSYYVDVQANEVYLSTAEERDSVISLTKLIGYTLSGATPSQLYQVFEITPQDEPYTIPQGFRLMTDTTSTAEESIYFETDVALTIPANCTGIEQANGDYLYKVPITQGYSIDEDVLGTSDGTESQEFTLSYTPALDDSISVFVNEGSGYLEWNRVDNFIDSTETSQHYVVEFGEDDSTTIIFGDGSAGKIPNIYTNGIIASYRIGGGIIGNVGANTITQTEQTLAEIVQTFNPSTAYVLGEDAEDIETAKIKSVAQISSLWRAVTLQDYENLAIANLAVLRARAIGVSGVNSVDLYMLPKGAATFTTSQFSTMAAFFDERKILGTTVTLHNPTYIEVNPVIAVKVLSGYSTKTEDIRTNIDSVLTTQFFVAGHYDFGESFVASDLQMALMSVEGVKSVYIYKYVDTVLTPITDIDINASEILTLSGSYNKSTSITFN